MKKLYDLSEWDLAPDVKRSIAEKEAEMRRIKAAKERKKKKPKKKKPSEAMVVSGVRYKLKTITKHVPVYYPVPEVWGQVWALNRGDKTLNEWMEELRDRPNLSYIVKLRWNGEPRRHFRDRYTIFAAELDISGNYFILSRINNKEKSADKPKLVFPHWEVQMFINNGDMEVYEKHRDNRPRQMDQILEDEL